MGQITTTRGRQDRPASPARAGARSDGKRSLGRQAAVSGRRDWAWFGRRGASVKRGAWCGGSPTVRDASERDAEACAAIYARYVTDTAITFESDPPPPAEMAQRIAVAVRAHAWVVLENEGRVVGYAYGGPFNSRAAYRWSCEVSVYLERGRRRTGGGHALYDALFARLAERGFHTAVAGMTLPNDASVALHRAMGFEPVGTFRHIGWKHDTWHDVAWAQRTITPGQPSPGDVLAKAAQRRSHHERQRRSHVPKAERSAHGPERRRHELDGHRTEGTSLRWPKPPQARG